MQKLSKIALFGLLGLLIMPLGYSALTDGLLGYWGFNENTGTNTYDSLLLTNMSFNATWASGWTTGKLGSGINFNGAGYIKNATLSTNIIPSNNDTISFNFWINDSISSNDAYTVFFAQRGGEASGNPMFMLQFQDQKFMFLIHDGSWRLATATNALTKNKWSMVSIVYNTTHINYYYDGVLNSSHAFTYKIKNNEGIGWFVFGNRLSSATSYTGKYFKMDEFAIWDKALTNSEITELYDSDNISDYNLTAIYDNSSIANNLVRFNVSYDLNFTGVNASGVVVPQLLTLNISDLGIFENITSNVARPTVFNNSLVSNYTVIVTDPFNESLSLTTYYIINEIVDIRDRSLTHFNYFNTSVNLNFSSICLCGGEFFADVYNLTIPALNISMRENTFGTADAVTFNNSNVYNYTVYVTHERFGNLVNKTFYFYTNAYNLSIPTYNSTIANNSYTDIAWYLSTITGYASSNQSINHSIVFNGVTTYPTATGLNYTYEELLTTNELVESIPFYLILNITLGNESLLFNQSYTLTITTIEIDDCSTYSNVLINLSMLNEIGKTLIANVTSIIVNFNISNALISVEVINDTDGIIPICINNTAGFNADVEFQFRGVGYGATDKYTREHFYINNYFVNNNTQQQSTYQLITDLALKKVFTIYDSSDNPLPGHYVVVKKWYGDGYETVAMAKTDANGQALTYVQYYNVYYALDILDEDGTLIFTVSKNLFSNADDTIRVTDTIFTQYEALFNTFDTSKSYNETSNVFSTTIVNNQGTESIIRIVVKDKFGIIQCDDTYTTSSVTATCTIPSPEGNSYTAQAYATVNSQTVYLYIFEFDEAISTFEDYGELGSFFAGLIVLGLSLMGSLFSFASIPFMAFIGVMISTFLGFIALDAVTLAGVGVMAVLIMVWFLRK